MELANTQTGSISRRDQLAAEVRILRMAIDVHMFEMAAKFIEAKELIPHGEWKNWLKVNADVSVRTAQDMMAAYRRFSGRADFTEIDSSKMFKLLPLPEESEEQFLQDHNVAEMSTREIQEAVKRVREEMNAEKDRALNALRVEMSVQRETIAEEEKKRAEEETREMMEETRRAAEQHISQLQKTIAEKEAAIEQMKAAAQAAMEGTENWRNERAELEKKGLKLQKEIDEQSRMMEDLQADLDRAQAELLNAKSEAARGDAERVPADRLTFDIAAGAVRQFIGTCARVPQMGMRFAGMDPEEKRDWDELWETVEKLAADGRKALNMVRSEGGFVL